jgi:hypothetical protein
MHCVRFCWVWMCSVGYIQAEGRVRVQALRATYVSWLVSGEVVVGHSGLGKAGLVSSSMYVGGRTGTVRS